MAGRCTYVPRLILAGSLQHFWSGDHQVELKVVWMGPSNCIVSEFYAHCDVITHHLKMEASWNPIISSSVATCQHACRIPAAAVHLARLHYVAMQCVTDA